jgi:8-oxo-dGTP pyrophosphatase MutT (NUDIX family)
MLRRRLRDVSRLPSLLADLAGSRPVAVDDPSRRQAAVALLFVPDPDRLLLIRRAEREGDPWSGHMALPGGRREPADQSLVETAIRETWEETGVRLGPPAAALDDHAPLTPVLPPILVRPFAFLLDHEPPVTPSVEVAASAWVPLEVLADPAAFRPTELQVRGARHRVSGYHLDAGVLWGMTERILTPVIALWRALGS